MDTVAEKDYSQDVESAKENIEPNLTHTQSVQTGRNDSLGAQELYVPHTYIEDSFDHLDPDHRDYLLKRHGTLDLDPLPSADPADPYNWPVWKKYVNLILVAFHAFMTTFSAASIIPAFQNIADDLGVSLERAAYLTSAQIALLGASPLFWKPVSYKLGRRPVWLISTICAAVCNVGCAESPSYASMMVCRCLGAFFISPAIAIGSGIVVETFFKQDRGRYMGMWTLMVTLGPPSGPFLMGFVAYHVGYRWIYWILAITNLVQFCAYLVGGPETRYLRANVRHNRTTFQQEYLSFHRPVDPKPLRAWSFIEPLLILRHPTILVPACAYALTFGFCSVFLTVEIPEIFLPKFGFNSEQLGLQFLGVIVGSIVGEQLGGPLSDWWMARKRRPDVNGVVTPVRPEYRLYPSYLGFLLAVVGLVVFGVRTQQAAAMHWNVTPIIGIGIAACGNQIVTTVLITYAVDCHPETSSAIGVAVNVVRNGWGFIGPFWFPSMIERLGMSGSGGLMAGLVGVLAFGSVVGLQVFRRERRVPSSV